MSSQSGKAKSLLFSELGCCQRWSDCLFSYITVVLKEALSPECHRLAHQYMWFIPIYFNSSHLYDDLIWRVCCLLSVVSSSHRVHVSSEGTGYVFTCFSLLFFNRTTEMNEWQCFCVWISTVYRCSQPDQRCFMNCLLNSFHFVLNDCYKEMKIFPCNVSC